MPEPVNIQTLGNQLSLVYDDGSQRVAYPSGVDVFTLTRSEPDPDPGPGPDPDPPQTSRFVWPFPLSQVTSEYGMRRGRLHAGIDFGRGSSNVAGTPIPCAADGTVHISRGGHQGFGNFVVVSHGGGLFTLYAHMTARSVTQGATVTQRQTLGTIGNTGNSFGNHLHFECHEGGFRYNASSRNPRTFFTRHNR